MVATDFECENAIGSNSIATTANNNLILIANWSSDPGLSDDPAPSYHPLQRLIRSFAASTQTHQHIAALAAQLQRIAEIAYSNRDTETVGLVADLLAQLPLSTAQRYGLYYRALVLKRDGLVTDAANLLGKLLDTPEAALRARALQTLGIIFQNSNKQADALYLYLESARLARTSSPLATFLAHWQLSELRSLDGDHRGALHDLNRLLPLVSVLSTDFPAFYYCFHNDRTVELTALGQQEEAKQSIDFALSFPLASRYPEWTETKNEIGRPAATARAHRSIPSSQTQPVKSGALRPTTAGAPRPNSGTASH